MAFLAKLYLVLGLTTFSAEILPIDGKNLPPENLYDVLVKNCPILKNVNDPSFKNQEIFKKCEPWQEISATKVFVQETNQQVLCLLYYDSFISLCTEINAKKMSNVTINLVPELKDYKVSSVCKNLALFPAGKSFEHVDKMINDEGICYKLCLNYNGTLIRECGLAHYFANYNISSTKVELPNTQELEPNTNKIKLMSAGIALKSSELDLSKSLLKKYNNSNNQAPVEPDNGKINIALNKETVPEPNSPKDEPNTMKTNPVLNPSNTLENNAESVDDNGNPPPGSNLDSAVANQKPTNLNDNDGSQAEKKSSTNENSKAHDETYTKDETHTKDEPQANNEAQAKDEPKHSQIPSIRDGSISEQNLQASTPETDQQKIDGGKEETNIETDQQNLDQAGLMIDNPNMEEEEGSDGNFDFSDKDDDDKQTDDNVGEKKKGKPSTLTVAGEMPANAEDLDGESYFFSYFMVICVLFVLGYVGYHNRQKVMALMLEGKRGKRQGRGRRPNSANYHKLDSNLEEAISSTCTKNSSHVIY